MAKYKIAVAGATGMVGRTFLKVLEEYKLDADYTLFSSARSAGTELDFMGKTHTVQELTDKQVRFVEEYLVDFNATQAALRAGYSPKTASRIGPELLGKTCIARAVERGMKDAAKKCELTRAELVRMNIEF